jgi:hypothetical protein
MKIRNLHYTLIYLSVRFLFINVVLYNFNFICISKHKKFFNILNNGGNLWKIHIMVLQ